MPPRTAPPIRRSSGAGGSDARLRSIAFVGLCIYLYVDLSAMTADPIADPLDWRGLGAPSLGAFEAIAVDAFRRLPQNFRALCTDLVIRVDDFPTDEVLDHLGAKTEFDLLGLFHGVGLPFRSESAPLHMPNMIWLYRRPILDYWAEHEETLGGIVTHVLVHEIGHHFGLSDADMEAIERQAG